MRPNNPPQMRIPPFAICFAEEKQGDDDHERERLSRNQNQNKKGGVIENKINKKGGVIENKINKKGGVIGEPWFPILSICKYFFPSIRHHIVW